MTESKEQSVGPQLRGPRLWEVRWVRDLLVLVVTLFLLHVIYEARAVTLPIIVAFALAYIFNPLITFANRRWNISRLVGTCLVFLLTAVILVAVLGLLGPIIYTQAKDFLDLESGIIPKVLTLLEQVSKSLDIDWSQLRATVLDMANQDDAGENAGKTVGSVSQFLINALGIGAGVVTSAISFVTYMAVFLLVVAFCFCFFSWKFGCFLDWFGQFIPESKREQTITVIKKMDQAVAGFVRGRLIQSLIMATILSIGWWITGVPFFLVLGLLCGILNLIPYAASIGWLAALAVVLANQLGSEQGFAYMALVWPSLVYFIAQSVDGWAVEPIVQGKATNLDPLTVLLAVMIGGVLAGLLGMLLAIPVAACVKILATEVLIPNLREYVQRIG